MEDVQNCELVQVESHALEAMERAQTDIQITTAKRYPRPDLSIVKKKMLSLATLDQETAEGCFYTLKRKVAGGGEKLIQGASARMSEIALSSFGNIKSAARVIGNDGKMITAQAVCHDLENNVSVAVEVKRRITDKNGRTFSDDMQVVTGNAACSIALRNAVFKVIPMALIKPVYEAAKAVAVGTQKTLSERRQIAFGRFAKYGIEQDRILTSMEKNSIEDINIQDLEILFGLLTAIKDGDQSIDEAFPVKTAEEKPKFGPGKDEEKKPETAPVVAPVAAPAPAPVVETVKATVATGLTLVEKINILCDENSVLVSGIVPALKALGRIPSKSNSIKSLDDLMDEQLAWIETNFGEMLKHMPAK